MHSYYAYSCASRRPAGTADTQHVGKPTAAASIVNLLPISTWTSSTPDRGSASFYEYHCTTVSVTPQKAPPAPPPPPPGFTCTKAPFKSQTAVLPSAKPSAPAIAPSPPQGPQPPLSEAAHRSQMEWRCSSPKAQPDSLPVGGKRVLFVRHAESEYNRACTDAEGWVHDDPVGGPDQTMSCEHDAYIDAPLTEVGARQAENAAAKFPQVQLVVVSPLDRAIQTAMLMCPDPPGGKPVAHEDVRERMYGPGMYNTEDGRQYDGGVNCTTRHPLSFKKRFYDDSIDFSSIEHEADEMWQAAATPETDQQLHTRVKRFLEWLFLREESTIAVFCHGDLIYKVFGEEYIEEMFEVDSQEWSRVTVDSVPNCSCHEVVITRVQHGEGVAPAAALAPAATIFPVPDSSSEFIKVGATGRAVQWLQDEAGPVGVMIAGNFGRPGGACMDSNNQFEFHSHARTQEESALSFIATLDPSNLHTIARELSAGVGSRYRMQPPEGTSDDFAVLDANDELVDIQTAGPDMYRKQYGFWVEPDVYLSFVAGPNAKHPGGAWPSPRPAYQGKLDTVYRTASRPAMESYDAFKQMVRNAIWSSLVAMREQGLERAIIAPLSCGIYGGEHKDRLRSEYYQLSIDVLGEVELSHGAFKEVLVPEYRDQRRDDHQSCWIDPDGEEAIDTVHWLPSGVARCKYGADCYRQNSAHLKRFAHPCVRQTGSRTEEWKEPTSKQYDQHNEVREAPDGEHYTYDQFVEYYQADADLEWQLAASEGAEGEQDKKAFLVSHGSFNPPHKGHVEMMSMAKQRAEDAGCASHL